MKKLNVGDLKKFLKDIPDNTPISIDNGYGDEDINIYSIYSSEDGDGKMEVILSID